MQNGGALIRSESPCMPFLLSRVSCMGEVKNAIRAKSRHFRAIPVASFIRVNIHIIYNHDYLIYYSVLNFRLIVFYWAFKV